MKDSDIRLLVLELAQRLPQNRDDARRACVLLSQLVDRYLWPVDAAVELRPRGRA
jgi:hypothetical protein